MDSRLLSAVIASVTLSVLLSLLISSNPQILGRSPQYVFLNKTPQDQLLQDGECPEGFILKTGEFCSEEDPQKCFSIRYCQQKETQAAVCGNGVCEPGETEATCPQDCRQPYPGPPEDTCDEIDFEMGQVQGCEQDLDCVFSQSIRGCRFPCGMAHNKDYGVAEVQALVTRWDSCHEWSCPGHGCPQPGNIRAVCIDKKCTTQEVPQECTSDAQCGEGFSCWAQVPKGNFEGTKGSAENSGYCWDDFTVGLLT